MTVPSGRFYAIDGSCNGFENAAPGKKLGNSLVLQEVGERKRKTDTEEIRGVIGAVYMACLGADFEGGFPIVK